MTEQEQLTRDLQEFRELWEKLSQQGKVPAVGAFLIAAQKEDAKECTGVNTEYDQ